MTHHFVSPPHPHASCHNALWETMTLQTDIFIPKLDSIFGILGFWNIEAFVEHAGSVCLVSHGAMSHPCVSESECNNDKPLNVLRMKSETDTWADKKPASS